jgi:hypothetical protein
MAKEKDLKWEECKKLVDSRDKRQCQFIRCLSITEFHQLKKLNNRNIDRCHIFSRSSFPDLIYNPNNIITLQRFIHERIDAWKDPLSGENIDIEYHFYWWWRIFNHSMENFDIEKNYELELLKKIREKK